MGILIHGLRCKILGGYDLTNRDDGKLTRESVSMHPYNLEFASGTLMVTRSLKLITCV